LSVLVPNEVQIITVEFAVDLGSYICDETLKNGVKWNKSQSVIKTRVFDRIYVFPRPS